VAPVDKMRGDLRLELHLTEGQPKHPPIGLENRVMGIVTGALRRGKQRV
jgi:hypothetical protein